MIVVFGVALHLPSLTWGFFCDDYGQQAVLRGVAAHATLRPWSLFDFGYLPGPSDPYFEMGVYPWWTSPQWKARFFRPVTSLTLWLDHTIFGDWAMGYHLTSLIWYAVLLALIYRLYRSLALPTTTALFALLLFTLSDSTVFPVGWPANRNTLVAACFTVASLLVLSMNRTRGHMLSMVGALLLAALAVLAKESGITAFVLIALYLQWQRRRTTDHLAKWAAGGTGGSPASVSAGDAGPGDPRHWIATGGTGGSPASVSAAGGTGGLPASVSVGNAGPGHPRHWIAAGTVLSLMLAGGYVAFLACQDYGTNSIFYAAPWTDPGEFVKRLAILATMGTLSLLGLSYVDLVFFLPHMWIPAVVISFVVVAPLARIIWQRVRMHPTAGFLVAWMALTLIPQSAAPPSDRLLLAPAVASSALLALFFSAAPLRKGTGPRPRSARIVALVILVTAGPASGLSTVVQGCTVSGLASELRGTILSADVGSPALGRREVFILQSPYALVAFNTLATWAMENDDHEIRFWPMQIGRRGLRWTRIDDRIFELESLADPFLTSQFESVFLASRQSPVPGTTFQTALFTIETLDRDETGLRRFRVYCPESLDTPRYRFLVPCEGRLTAIHPPGVGETHFLNAVEPPRPFVP